MFNKGETYHEFQMFNLGNSSYCMENPDAGVQESRLYKHRLEICHSFSMRSYSSCVFSRNCTACFHFVGDQ